MPAPLSILNPRGLALLGMLAACGGGGTTGPPAPPPPPPPPPGGGPTITVSNSFFNPATVTVTPGTTVTFTWETGAVDHNVTPTGSNLIPTSGNLPATRNAPFSFQANFPAAGTFPFYCSVHGGPGAGMAGTVTVQP